MSETSFSWLLLTASAFMNAYGAFLIKLNLNRQGQLLLDSMSGIMAYVLAMLRRPQVLTGFIFWAISPLLFALSLSRIELTVGQPVFIIINFLLIFANGVIFLKERITRQKLTAIALAVASVIFFSMDQTWQ